MAEKRARPIPFKAETRQLLDILIHSLYTEHEIFLRELISNASDALTRLDFEMLTNREVLDPQAELAITIIPNAAEGTLTIEDTGIGMTAEEMTANLGTIAHSGARDFISAAKERDQAGVGAEKSAEAEESAETTVETPAAPSTSGRSLSDLIGQFGVGFYSAFMVADWIRVTSRSYKLDAQAATWFSKGNDTFTVEPAERAQRGTTITLKLKADAKDFLEEYRLREIIHKHSDFIPFPIYMEKLAPMSDQMVPPSQEVLDAEQEKKAAGEKKLEQVNHRTAIWRQQPREVEKKSYDEFYQQFTLDFDAPLLHVHMNVDAPVQMYALLFIPARGDRGMYSLRKEPGLKLYARKVLIQEYNKELLPEYLPFVTGVVDSEDIPLNVSRESVQANRVMAQLRKLVTSKVLSTLEKLAKDEPETYEKFWVTYGKYLKHGISAEPKDIDEIFPLLRFRTLEKPDSWTSLEEYVAGLKEGQSDIYYLLGEDEHSVRYSPHLDVVRKLGYNVIFLTETVDSFMLMQVRKYKEHNLTNVATAKLELPLESKEGEDQPKEEMPAAEQSPLIERFKAQLGDRVQDVRMTQRLADSPARLVDPEGIMRSEFQRVYRYLDKDYQVPKKVLELNPRHAIITRLGALAAENPLSALIIEQIYEDALLIEGLHPEPASMISRIQKIIEQALGE